jgi:hypothetical protein
MVRQPMRRSTPTPALSSPLRATPLSTLLTTLCALSFTLLSAPALSPSSAAADDTPPTPAPALSRETVQSVHKRMAEVALRTSIVGLVQQVEHEAVAIIKQVTRLLNENLPDCERVLTAMSALRDKARPAAESISRLLKEHRAQLRRAKPPALKNYQDKMASTYAAELAAYERAVARFELISTNEQLLRFNALMKGIASPLMD